MRKLNGKLGATALLGFALLALYLLYMPGQTCECAGMLPCACELLVNRGTAVYEGVEVRLYKHVDGKKVRSTWSDPLDARTNTLCSRALDAPAEQRCPDECAASANRARVSTKRVRRAIGQLSDEEWARVVAAMWEIKNLTEAEGQAKYGPEYRSMDYHNVRHVAATLSQPGEHDGENATVGVDVTGGGAQTYTWHALFTMEFETSLLLIDPLIGGLPFIDWGRDAELTARRLGQATLDVPYEMNANVLNPGGCEPTPSGRCQMAALADGDFAWWPVGQLDMDAWYASQSKAVQALFSELHVSGFISKLTNASQGQLRPKVNGGNMFTKPAPVYLQEDAPTEDAPIPYVLRYRRAWESVFFNQSDTWNEAVAVCLGLDDGLYQDVSECIEGRVQANLFRIHFSAHFIGGDMQFATVPHDPLFYFHHCGLDRLRRQWQARNERVRPMAYGYPTESIAYTEVFGTPVGLHDCLGCTSYDAGFTKELLLGTSNPEYASLPLSDGWLTPADLLCVLDDIYTYDVLTEGEEGGGEEGGALLLFEAAVWVAACALTASYLMRKIERKKQRRRAGASGVDGEAVGSEEDDLATGRWDTSPNDAHVAARGEDGITDQTSACSI